jgi:5,5'-dehydrodivanillate O-demethylase
METLTEDQNRILTQVGKATPMGELLRRYWWPVGISADLQDRPTLVRILGEDLVLFRDGGGRVGLLEPICSHRRANLCIGNIDKLGLRCRYHGWLYDIHGKVLHTPGEPAESKFHETIIHLSYPAQELGGLVFAYLGPKPAPLLPRFDFIAGEGEHYANITGFANCNWLQCVENGMDPLHVSFTHQGGFRDLHDEPDMCFEETEWGIVHKAWRFRPEQGMYNYREHHLLMPGISAGGSNNRRLEGGSGTPPTSARWSVPIDDTHTMNVRVAYKPADNPGRYTQPPIDIGWLPIPIEPYREYKTSPQSPKIGYEIPAVVSTEDAIVMDSMPRISDREKEHLLPVGDSGMRRLRYMYWQALKTVQAGGDPPATLRDAVKNQVIIVPSYERLISKKEYQGMTQRKSGVTREENRI